MKQVYITRPDDGRKYYRISGYPAWGSIPAEFEDELIDGYVKSEIEFEKYQDFLSNYWCSKTAEKEILNG